MVNILSLIILLITAVIRGEMMTAPLAIILFAITSFFALSITILYTGLSPSVLFMDIRVVVKY